MSLGFVALSALVILGCHGEVATNSKSSARASPAPGTPVSQSPVSPPVVKTITWESLEIPMPVNSKFERWMLTYQVEQLEGKQVRIEGFMFGGALFMTTGIKNFPLLREKECPFGEGGQAYHAIDVMLAGPATIDFTPTAVTLEGTFHVRPYTGSDGNTWAVYALDGAKVVKVE